MSGLRLLSGQMLSVMAVLSSLVVVVFVLVRSPVAIDGLEAPASRGVLAVTADIDLPAILAWEEYAGREGQDAWCDLNPFIPFFRRGDERWAGPDHDDAIAGGSTPSPRPRPSSPAELDAQPVFPVLDSTEGDLQLVGLLQSADRVIVRVLDISGRVDELAPGQSNGIWRFLGLRDGGLLFLHEQRGIHYRHVPAARDPASRAQRPVFPKMLPSGGRS